MIKKRTWIIIAGILAGIPACVLLLLVLAWKGLLPGTENRLTILMYHQVVSGEEEINGMAVTQARLREDLVWLKDHGYTAVLPRELAEGTPLPRNPVMITFDDGYAGNYHYAFPLLRELNMKAEIALIIRGIDSGDSLFLDWDMCREMHQSGLVELGSHSYNLHNLDERDGLFVNGGSNGIQRMPGEDESSYQTRVFADLGWSVTRIWQEIDAPTTCFSYPFGATEPWAIPYLRNYFSMTLTTREGTADLSGGPWELPRKTVTMDRPASACLSFRNFLREFRDSMLEKES